MSKAPKDQGLEPLTEAEQVQAQAIVKELRKLRYQVKLRNFAGHAGQEALWYAKEKKVIIRAGRRGGKTTGAALKAVDALIKGRRVLYATPTIDQVGKFWKECKRMLDEPIRYGVYKKNETEHTIEPRNANPNSTDEPRIRDAKLALESVLGQAPEHAM